MKQNEYTFFFSKTLLCTTPRNSSQWDTGKRASGEAPTTWMIFVGLIVFIVVVFGIAAMLEVETAPICKCCSVHARVRGKVKAWLHRRAVRGSRGTRGPEGVGIVTATAGGRETTKGCHPRATQNVGQSVRLASGVEELGRGGMRGRGALQNVI
jgi:hypothetical protein